MRRDFSCRCCGLGLALANFSGMQAVFNFTTARIGTSFVTDSTTGYSNTIRSGLVTDENGWQVMHVAELDKYTQRFVDLAQSSDINRVAFKFDDQNEVVRIQIRIRVFEHPPSAGRYALVGLERWRWDLEYEIPYDNYNDLVATGRLRLNPYQTSATHSGSTSETFVIPASISQGLINEQLSGVTNNPAELGDIVLVWPPFELDFTNHRLVFSLVAANPVVPVQDFTVEEFQAVNLAWAQQPREFVFDETTVEPDYSISQPERFNRLFRDRITHNYASECYGFAEATHRNYLQVDPRTLGALQFIPAAVEVIFTTASGCERIGDGQPINSGLAMLLGLQIIFWKAFQVDNVLVTTEHFTGSPATSPVLCRSSPATVPRPLRQDQRAIGSATLTVEISPLS